MCVEITNAQTLAQILDHQTLVEICRNMGICCGFMAVAARGKYPGFILLDRE